MSVVAPSFSGETPFLVCIARPLPPEEAWLRRADCPLGTTVEPRAGGVGDGRAPLLCKQRERTEPKGIRARRPERPVGRGRDAVTRNAQKDERLV